MIPKRIELENFLSFGKPAVVFTFSDDEPLWVLCGQNGAGKSAVFDGITYALYGEHRGGQQKSEQLVRHGANGFRVVFDFEFAGVEYRITRSRAVKSGTTQKVEVRRDGEWEAIQGVNKAPEIRKWVEEKLGLGFKAFTASVLLRQGEADKLFSASRDERIALLKGIIGFEQFEAVAKRVNYATKDRKAAYENLQDRLKALAELKPEELAQAETTLAEAEQQREQAQTAFTTAAQRVEQAKQWDALAARRIGLEKQLAAAAQRAQEAETIRTANLRLDELTAAVPLLEALVPLRDKLSRLRTQLDEATAARERTAGEIEAKITRLEESRQKGDRQKEQAAELERQAKKLGEEIERGTKFLDLAQGIDILQAKLGAYPPDLAAQLAAVATDEEETKQAQKQAATALAAAAALLQQAQAQQARFANVKVGVTCSECGQRVDEAHAAKERTRLQAELQARQTDVSQGRAALEKINQRHAKLRQEREGLQKSHCDWEKLVAEIAAKRHSLTQLGGVADAAQLRARLAEQAREKAQAAKQLTEVRTQHSETLAALKRLEVERIQLDELLKKATAQVRTLDSDLTTSTAQRNAKSEQLAPAWRSRLDSLDANAVAALAAERQQLQRAGVAQQFELLRQDEAMRSEWAKQLGEVESASAEIPAEARIAPAQAQQLQEQAKAAARQANVARDAALNVRDQLKARAEERQRLRAEERLAEGDFERHKKLDRLLGQEGLQRELVRDAEQQIVTLANETLQNLSDGDLALEPDEDAEGRDDKAFALRVRRVGDPFPINVVFLSGSQKFRVAISVALAVGRFASGRARPLEAVIVDEGFASLDKEGLRAMADELKRLQQAQALKRIVLVSHQEEFTGQFPVGYQLHPADTGTTATPFRR